MSDPHAEPRLDDVIEPEEISTPDRREHAKADPRPDQDALEERLDHERAVAESDQSGG